MKSNFFITISVSGIWYPNSASVKDKRIKE